MFALTCLLPLLMPECNAHCSQHECTGEISTQGGKEEAECLPVRYGRRWCYVGEYSECRKNRRHNGKYVSEEACQEIADNSDNSYNPYEIRKQHRMNNEYKAACKTIFGKVCNFPFVWVKIFNVFLTGLISKKTRCTLYLGMMGSPSTSAPSMTPRMASPGAPLRSTLRLGRLLGKSGEFVKTGVSLSFLLRKWSS